MQVKCLKAGLSNITSNLLYTQSKLVYILIIRNAKYVRGLQYEMSLTTLA